MLRRAAFLTCFYYNAYEFKNKRAAKFFLFFQRKRKNKGLKFKENRGFSLVLPENTWYDDTDNSDAAYDAIWKGGAVCCMITSKELAALAGVSQSTVSRCLNDSPLVSEKTRERVKALAEQYSFTFNSAARGLKTNRSGAVGYVFSENFESFTKNVAQSTLYYSIRQQLYRYELDLIPIFDNHFPSDSREMSNIEQYIRNRRVDGLVVNRTSLDPRLLELLYQNKMPCIFVYDPDDGAPYSFVIASNHIRSGQLVGNAFAEKGYDRFIEVLGIEGRADVARKHAGFASALEAHGLSISPERMFYGKYDFESGYQIASRQIDAFREANACFVHNDIMALGVMKALHEHSVRIPEDLAIIGHDNIEMADWFYPRLSTISVNYDRISCLCADWMAEALRDESVLQEERKVIINGELVIRDTF